MKLTAHFRLLNYDFSQEHADANHNGEPSENNRLYDWEDELALKNEIIDLIVERESSYFLQGTYSDGKSFSEEVKNMMIFKAIGSDNSETLFACSEETVEMYSIEKNENHINLIVDLSEREPVSNPIPGIYIASQAFPKNLID